MCKFRKGIPFLFMQIIIIAAILTIILLLLLLLIIMLYPVHTHKELKGVTLFLNRLKAF